MTSAPSIINSHLHVVPPLPDGDYSIDHAFSTDRHWATSLDFKDAFFHVPIAIRTSPLPPQLPVRQPILPVPSLSFGLATSPRVFTRLVKAVGTFARAQGLCLLQYLDGWNITALSAQACADWTSWLLNLSDRLGLIINLTKCDLVPSRRFKFVGIDFDLNDGTARPTQHRVQNRLRTLQISPRPRYHRPSDGSSYWAI